MRFVVSAALAAAVSGAWGGSYIANQAQDRGMAPIQGAWMPGRPELAANAVPGQVSGMLVDAGCRNRSALNLGVTPLPFADSLAKAPVTITDQTAEGGVSAFGITVSPETLKGERGNVMLHHTPDMLTRQTDPTCAVTASTKEFALLLADGRLVNLDPGGTTLAWAGIQATAEGRAMLNGMAPGLKPYAVMDGFFQGSTLVVENAVEVLPSIPPSSGGATRMKTP